jgi:hypothetical protein
MISFFLLPEDVLQKTGLVRVQILLARGYQEEEISTGLMECGMLTQRSGRVRYS